MTDRPEPRVRKTRPIIHFWDRCAEIVISVGGVGVIAAVLGICFYLFWTVLPLFRGGEVEELASASLAREDPAPVIVLDDYRLAASFLGTDGVLRSVSLSDGATIDERQIIPDGRELTAWAHPPGGGLVALGYSDGTMQVGEIRWQARLLPEELFTRELGVDPEDPPAAAVELVDRLRALERGQSTPVPARLRDGRRPILELRDPGDDGPGGVVQRTAQDELRLIVPEVELGDPTPVPEGEGAIEWLDISQSPGGTRYVTLLREDGTALYNLVSIRRPMGGGPARVRLLSRSVELQPVEEAESLYGLFVTADGDNVLALWDDGTCQRYAAMPDGGPTSPFVLMETLPVVTPGARLTAAAKVLGSQTLAIGDSEGGAHLYYPVRDPAHGTADQRRFYRGHTFEVAGGAVVAFGMSDRNRTMVIADEAGGLQIRHATSRKHVVTVDSGFEAPVVVARLTPRNDGLVAVDAGGQVRTWSLDPGFPGVSFGALFARMNYEGQLGRAFVYQSTSGDDATEVKLSLMPLIFGTLKATVFAMLFAVPLAVLAAVYTSEFMHPSVHRVVKPSIELMASLPSVVLGFVAAMLVAPLVSQWLPSVLLGFIVVPLGCLVGAHVWQVVAARWAGRLHGTRHIAAVATVIGLSVWATAQLAPAFERAMFTPTENEVLVLAGWHEAVEADEWPDWVRDASSLSLEEIRRLRARGLFAVDGALVRPRPPADAEDREALELALAAGEFDEPNVRAWLDGVVGGPWPGWFLLLIMPACVVVLGARWMLVDRAIETLEAKSSAGMAGLLHAGRFALTIAGVFGAAGAGAWALSWLGYDPRDSFFGTFSQRNTLVVGVIMGFAIIPIIYTISEDAMRSVPRSLRLASLGAGATQWQTAIRVVMPVAASGIFSACMIGLGRAVGETMIVLMATGNTPEISWNIFSGFRTLAANIAVELPEAPQGSTHYRVLFLCGLVLFVMTFVINTTAELVRQHVRRRNAAL